MSAPDEMGLTPEAAQGYEDFFVPAIFDQWPARIIHKAQISNGDTVLEVGCGTGVFTREALNKVGDNGAVTGVDLSDAMLGVARAQSPAAEFQQANAMALPFDDGAFDVVVSSFMLMFVAEPEKALSEMLRVLKPGGRLAVAVWESLGANPAYSKLVSIARKRLGQKASSSLARPFALGQPGRMEEIAKAAGVENTTISKHDGRAKFPSVENFVTTEIRAWVLGEEISDEQIKSVVEDAKGPYKDYCDDASGALDMPLNAIILSAIKN